MDGGFSSHIKYYSSTALTRTLSLGVFSPSKSFTIIYLLLILILNYSCTEANNSTKETKIQSKISSSLQAVIEELQSKTKKKGQGLTLTDKSVRINEHGEIQIYIQLYEIDVSKLEDLKKHGVTIDIYDNKQKLVQGWALPAQIKMISELPYVKFIDLPTYRVSN